MSITTTSRQIENETQDRLAGGPELGDDQWRSEIQHETVVADPFLIDQPVNETQSTIVDEVQLSTDQVRAATQNPAVGGNQTGGGDHQQSEAHLPGVAPSYGYLLMAAKTVDEVEELRKATDNRLRQLTRTELDSDGVLRGLGMDARSPEVAKALEFAEHLDSLEREAVRALERAMKKLPYYEFVENTKGLGAKTVARLIAEIGDPYWNTLYDRPRTVSELWAYCGLAVNGGYAQRRRKGELANWSDEAKKRVWIIAQQPIKLGGPYREVYDAAREKYAEAVHPHECVRCGPAGNPAQPGSPLSDGHKHARAIRIMCKEILKDLWVAARDAR